MQPNSPIKSTSRIGSQIQKPKFFVIGKSSRPKSKNIRHNADKTVKGNVSLNKIFKKRIYPTTPDEELDIVDFSETIVSIGWSKVIQVANWARSPYRYHQHSIRHFPIKIKTYWISQRQKHSKSRLWKQSKSLPPEQTFYVRAI